MWNRGEGFEKSYVPLHGGQKFAKSSLIKEWPPKTLIISPGVTITISHRFVLANKNIQLQITDK